MISETEERVRTNSTMTHAEAVDMLYAVTAGVMEYLGSHDEPESNRLCNALRLANDLVRKTLPHECSDTWG